MKWIVTILLISAIACTRKVYLPGQIIVKDSLQFDSIIVTKDSLITVPGATVTITDTVPCDTSLLFHLQQKRNGATIIVKGKGNKITATCECDSLKILVQNLRRELIRQTNFKNRTEVKIEQVPKPVKHIPKWVYAVLLYAFFVTAWQLRKPIIKLIQYYKP